MATVDRATRAELSTAPESRPLRGTYSPEEVERGYVLTCQSHPTSERVVLDFDA